MPTPNTIKNIALTVLLGSSVISQATLAQGGGGRGERRGPPPEAIEACANTSEGEYCEFSGRSDDTLQGTCIALSDEDALVCKPEGAPEGGRGGERSER